MTNEWHEEFLKYQKFVDSIYNLSLYVSNAAEGKLFKKSIEKKFKSMNGGLSKSTIDQSLVSELENNRKSTVRNFTANSFLYIPKSALKNEKFDTVLLAFQGETKFSIDGSYFNTLGMEFGEQNPIYTIRTFSENLLDDEGKIPMQNGKEASWASWGNRWKTLTIFIESGI